MRSSSGSFVYFLILTFNSHVMHFMVINTRFCKWFTFLLRNKAPTLIYGFHGITATKTFATSSRGSVAVTFIQ